MISKAARRSAPGTGQIDHTDIFGGIEMAPRPKKRKNNPTKDTNPDSPSPVVFVSPGLQPDVRITAYGKYEYHLHSVVLKLHSNYFRQFLERNNSASTEFQYEYVSAKGEEGWVVEPKGESTATWNSEALGDSDERNALETLFRAMYNRPYAIESPEKLKIVTKIADFYCALPILSATLSAALYESLMFCEFGMPYGGEITRICYDLIFTARKLRHAGLFRECFIHIVGTWMDHAIPEELLDPLKQDPELLSLINAACIDLCRALLEVDHELLLSALEEDRSDFLRCHPSLARGLRPSQKVRYYMRLKDRLEIFEQDMLEEFPNLSKAFDNLLKNNLVFDRSNFATKNVLDDLEDDGHFYFLCADIKDDDLPWDLHEVDF